MIRTCSVCGQGNRVPARHLASNGKCGACKTPLPPLDRPLEADTATFDDVIRNSPVPVLVDFWAEWCGPCRTAAPEVARTAADLAGRAVVLEVDTDRHPELAQRFEVTGIPSFAVFARGQKVRQQAGVVDYRQLERWLAEAAA